MTLTTQPGVAAAQTAADIDTEGLTRRRGRRRRPKETSAGSAPDRTLISPHEVRRPGIRRTKRTIDVLVLLVLVIIGLGPLLWLGKSAITPTQDTLRQPMALFPHGADLGVLWQAWSDEHLDRYFANTVVMAGGAWVSQLVVATTAGYALSVLRPKYGPILNAMVVGTLLVPVVVLLVPLYLTVLDPPLIHHSMLNSYWAIWLPAAASPFNVVLIKRFFDNLPREVFEAARVDGAGPFRVFWSIVLPLSRPILGVVSVFAIVATWKDFLWPLLVITDPQKQPLSVRLPALADVIELNVLLAALFISTLIPIILFCVFQRFFLSGAGLSGAVKG